MPGRIVQIVDGDRNVLAALDASPAHGRYSGSADFSAMPADRRRLFDEYEGIVNDQVFSLLDEYEDRIEGLACAAVFDDGSCRPIADVQLFPGGGTASFQVLEPAASGGHR